MAVISEVPAALSSEPEWRREVAHRLEAYRARRQRQEPEDSQNALPFVAEADAATQETNEAESTEASEPDPRASLRLASRPRKTERMEILALQPELDFVATEDAEQHPDTRLVPVAELDERRRAGTLDASFLLLTYAGFLVLFGSLGGQFSFGKLDAAVYGITFFLFYAQYFALFTAFDGATPGMRMRGLHVVSFDGSAPTTRQLLWRSFGYLLSGGTLLLGFLWSLWDEDQLTWQDRISQTYLTDVQVPAAEPSAAASQAGTQR